MGSSTRVLTDLSPEIGPAATGADLSDTDRTSTVVLSRVPGPKGRQVYADLLQNPGDHHLRDTRHPPT